MPPKIKKQTRRARPAVQFTVRRIANRNPRNARNFRQFRRKLSRLTAGLLALILLVSGMFLTGGNLKSDLVASMENSSCAASELTANFENLTTRLANLSREFPELIDNLDFCGEDSCAAEDLIYKNENEIWQLESDLATLKTETIRAKNEFSAALAEKEDGVLLCANESTCATAEAALSDARKCEKEFQNLDNLFATRATVRSEYSLVTEKGARESAAEYVKKIMETIFKNRDRVTENTKFYEQCVAASDASVCQKYVEKVAESEASIVAAIDELGGLQIDIDDALDAIEDDIVALEIGRSDSKNTNENEGLGWCTQKLNEKKTALFAKISAAADKKTAYSTALKNLTDRKLALRTSLQSEIEAEAMHAAAEKQAAEEAAALAVAEKAAAEKRAQAEIIFGIWTTIRNGF